MSISRRSFIKSSAAGAVGLSLSEPAVKSILASPQKETAWTNGKEVNPNISNMRVICCHDPLMLTKYPTSTRTFSTVNNCVDANRVSANMDGMAMSLAQKTTPDEAWKTIFRSSKAWSETKAAIKVNSVEPLNMPRVAIVKKITDVLVGFGVKPNNIVLFDGHGNAAMSGKYTDFASLTDTTKIQAVVSKQFDGIGGTKNVTVTGATGTVVCAGDLVSGAIDILVSIAVNKGHVDYVGGATLCMKNHFGTFTGDLKASLPSSVLHSIDALLGINKHDAILGGDPVRQQLCIVDSLMASKGGPSGGPDSEAAGGRLDRIIMGTFAPAVDFCTIKNVREGVAGWTLPAATYSYTKQFLTNFGYTESSPQFIESGSTGVFKQQSHTSGRNEIALTLSNPEFRSCEIRFSLPAASSPVEVKILDVKGCLIRQFSILPENGKTISWDGKSSKGKIVPSGSYVVNVKSDGKAQSGKMLLRK